MFFVEAIDRVLILTILIHHRLTVNIKPTRHPFVPSLLVSDIVFNEEIGTAFHLVQVACVF